MNSTVQVRQWRKKNPERAKTHWRKQDKKRGSKARPGYNAEYRRLKRKVGLAIIRDAKNRPCMDCGKQFPPCAMDFDHVRGSKKRAVCQMSHFNPVLILAEIEKCEVVCANCHRIRTSERKKNEPIPTEGVVVPPLILEGVSE